MADSLETRIQIAVDAASAAQSVGELKSAIRELEGIAATAGENNKEAFLKAAQEAGKFKDQIEDARDAVSTFKGDPLESLSKGIGSLKGRLLDLDFKGFSEEVGRLKTVSKGVTFKELAGSIGETASAFGSLGKILLTNPIFLIGTIIATVVSNFDKLTEAGGFVGAMFNGIKNAIGFVVDGLKSLTDAIGLTGFAAQEAAEKQIKVVEQIKDAIKGIDDDIAKDRQEALDKYDGNLQQAYEAEKTRISEVMASNDLQIAQYEELIASGKKLTSSQTETFNFFKTENEKLKVSLADFEKDVNEDNAKKAKERSDNAKKIKKEQEDVILALEKDSYKARLIELDRFYDDLKQKANGNKDLLLKIKKEEEGAKAVLDDQERSKTRNKEEGITKIVIDNSNVRLATKTSADVVLMKSNVDLTKSIKRTWEEVAASNIMKVTDFKASFDKVSEIAGSALDIAGAISEMRVNKIQENSNRELSILEEQRIKDLSNKDLTEEKRAEIENGYAKKKFQIELKAAQDSNKIKERIFKANKAFNLANAIGDGAAAVIKAWNSAIFPANIPAVIATGTAAAASILKISATKYTPDALPSAPDFTDVSGGGGGGGGAPAPTFTPPQFFGLGQGQLQSGQPGGQQQVVVLENDITRTQNRVRVIENRATIG